MAQIIFLNISKLLPIIQSSTFMVEGAGEDEADIR